jgi:hypothetical protein
MQVGGWQVGPLVDPISESAEPKVPQLYGLLSSMMKVAGNSRIGQILEAEKGAALRQRFQLSMDLEWGEFSTALQYSEVVVSTACDVLGDVLNSRDLTAIHSRKATAMPPWLALLGRGSIFYGAQLQSLLAAAEGQSSGSSFFDNSIMRESACTQFVIARKFDVRQIASIAKACLGSSSAAAHLSSVGYDLQPLLQQLPRLTAALQAAGGDLISHPPPAYDLTVYQELSVQLTAVGKLLAALAHPYGCNNPRCQTLTGPSEVQLVIGRSTKCGACRTARYCCKACLKQHWQQHKPVCKGLAAAAATAAAAAAATAAVAASAAATGTASGL